MSTNGVNGANGTPKTAADFKPEELKNAQEEKVKNTIFQLDKAITNDVEAIQADGEIDNTETDRIYDWVHVIDNMVGNMSSKVKQSYAEGVQVLKDWVAELIDMTGMGQYFGENVEYDGENVKLLTGDNTVASIEPQQTDAEVASSQVKVPKRMYWKADQADLESVYEALVNPQGRRAGFYNRPQVKIGGLLGFVAEYSNRLDKEQVAFIRNYIQNLNEISKQQEEEDEKPKPQAFSTSASNLPDADKVKAYWNAIKSAGFSHNLEAELMVLGYSKKDAKQLASQV